MVPLTQRLRFLVAVRPGLTEPAFAARTAATLDRLSNGRLLINVVTGGDPVELKGDGVFLDHDERYDVTDEFLSIWRRLHAGRRGDETGKHLRIEKGKLLYPPVQKPYPPLYFGGSSAAGNEVAAKHVDVYLTWGEPPADVAEKIAAAKAAAAAQGRTLSFGIRLHVIVRETSAEAWKAADDLISQARRRDHRHGAEGLRPLRFRRPAAHGGAAWRAARQARDLARTSGPASAWCAAVPGPRWSAIRDEVAERMKEYMALGIDRFILSGYPHLEECYRFAELVFPKLPLKATTGNDARSRKERGPFGEIIANVVAPSQRKSGSRLSHNGQGNSIQRLRDGLRGAPVAGTVATPPRPLARVQEPRLLDDLARILERGLFDGIFLADVLGVYDVYGGSPDAALPHAAQVPVNDPLLLVPAMAAVTEHSASA